MSGLQESQTCADALNAIPTIGTEKRNPKTKLCECGCGKPAPISKVTNRKKGRIKGKPSRFISGHNRTIRGGIRKTRIYGIWWGMNQRCYNINEKAYQYYGARGIGVCSEWRSPGGITAFIDFMKSIGWHEETTLQMDRRNNNMGYFPENVRLANNSVQAFNSRIKSNNKSGYSGVIYYKRDGNYRAFITINQNQIHLGYYPNPYEAAIARDKFIIEHKIKGAHTQVLRCEF